MRRRRHRASGGTPREEAAARNVFEDAIAVQAATDALQAATDALAAAGELCRRPTVPHGSEFARAFPRWSRPMNAGFRPTALARLDDRSLRARRQPPHTVLVSYVEPEISAMTTAIPDGQHPPGAGQQFEPFRSHFRVPVSGGTLTVARAGRPPGAGANTVLALHGMSGTYAMYRTVARDLAHAASRVCLLAPDLRGRGRSAGLPGPYGMAAHVSDLIAVLDHAGVERAIVTGSSMGSNIAARLADDHPERVAAVLLLDSGLPIVVDAFDSGPDEEHADEPPGLFDRFERTFPTVDDYLAYWRAHPALAGAWNEDVEVMVHNDFVVDEDGVRPVANIDAVMADVRDLVADGRTWTAVTRLSMPVHLLRAERGLHDDEPLIPLPELRDFLTGHPHVTVDLVPDVNHFTLVTGAGPGPHRVAAKLLELAAGYGPVRAAAESGPPPSPPWSRP
jgi:lipase